MISFKNAASVALLGVAMLGAYAAGRAEAALPDAVNKLNQAHDLLTKARAVLDNAGTNRMGYGNVEKAKASIDTALAETQKAVNANGG